VSELRAAIEDLRSNDRQWRAFEAPSPCVVLAPPGSGKTKLLTTRLAYDLLVRIPEPHGAACITMTNTAADQLADRLAQLGVRRRSNLFVGTVHRFALRCIVGPYARLGGLPAVAEASLAGDGVQRTARAQAVEEIFGGYQNPNAPDLITTLNQRRNLMNYEESARELGGSRFAQLARRYEELLLASGHYDFKDLVRFAVELVERNDWVQRVLAARFPHLYVDEYQDLAPGLDRLVQALCFDQRADAELFAVGDPDQAIFGFSGTKPQLLRDLAARASVNDVSLEWNYRSPQKLIDAAIRHLGKERAVRGRPDGGSIEAIECSGGIDHQLTETRRLIAEQRALGVPLDEIAVVARFNKALDRTVASFEGQLPVFARRDRGYGQTPATSLLEAMAAWSVQPRDGRGVRFADVVRRARTVARGDQSTLKQWIEIMLSYRGSPDAPATDFVEAIATAEFASRLRRGRGEDDVQEFARMRDALASEGDLEGTTVEDLGLRAKARDRLLISTVHGVKGLEFDIVIILEVEDGVMPFFKAESPAQRDEERRTFYVAMTRAPARLLLVESLAHDEGRAAAERPESLPSYARLGEVRLRANSSSGNVDAQGAATRVAVLSRRHCSCEDVGVPRQAV
jgi:DNA helicase-2/ATP-dependent DNA helicase PcrA